MISLVVNGKKHVVDVSPDTPLLYVLRNDLGLNGPKFGCGLGQCGACTVIMDGAANPLLRNAGGEGCRPEDPDTGRARFGGETPSDPEGVHRRAGGPVRLLHQRNDHDEQGAARPDTESDGRGDPAGPRSHSLPLRHAYRASFARSNEPPGR